jgi:aminomethyltransferase
MGRLQFEGSSPDGADVIALLDGLTTRRVTDMKPGQVRYSLVTRDDGGILDDILVYRLPCEEGKVRFLLVVNASNREKIIGWIKPRAEAAGVRMIDLTLDWSMIAVQGPRARELVHPLVAEPVDVLRYYQCKPTKVAGRDAGGATPSGPALVSRTGYTGEDGYELIVPANIAESVWTRLLADGAALGAMACGLASRDTLRLEAAMPLYGHELNEEINPFEAGLNFAVNVESRSFPGRDALLRAQTSMNLPKRVGLSFDGKRVPREGYHVVAGGKPVGRVTSGTFSITFQHPIAMAYVEAGYDVVGRELAVDIRGREEPCRVVALPFYKRESG